MRAGSVVKWLAGLALGLGLAAGASAQTTVRYVHTDALGSVVALTDQNRVVVERREYEPYGQQLTPAVADGPGFTGHVQDAASGLTYMQQRYYDPGVGKFFSVDPVGSFDNGDMRHFNRFAYAYNNPYRFTDPDGREGACMYSPSICGLRELTPAQVERRDQAYEEVGSAVVAVVSVIPAVRGSLAVRSIYRGYVAYRSVPAAYRVAAAGGRHAGFLRQQLARTPGQLQKTIRNIEKRIEEHKEKIRNPEGHMSRDEINPQTIARARADWAGDIARQKEQRDIAREVLKRASCTGSRISGNC